MLIVTGLTGCGGDDGQNSNLTNDTPVYQALSLIGADSTVISVPKLGPQIVSPVARLPLVDRLMSDPLELRHVAYRLLDRDSGSAQVGDYLRFLLATLGFPDPAAGRAQHNLDSLDAVWHAVRARSIIKSVPLAPPKRLREDRELAAILARLIATADLASRDMSETLAVSDAEWAVFEPLLRKKLGSLGSGESDRWLTDKIFQTIGARLDLQETAASLAEITLAAESLLSFAPHESWPSGEWPTPLGRLRIGTSGPDRYSGEYFIIIDPGGDDNYHDVAAPIRPGSVLVVADLAGNDTVRWQTEAGPGAGILGYSVWFDLAGDDRYVGNNIGAAAAVIGAGMLLDRSGNDYYEGGSLVQSAATYGIAVLLDEAGSDQYKAGLTGQGFGGPAGIALLIDTQGNDRYACGGLAPDRMEERRKRHQGEHYLSMCQGFAFGFRPDVSGGFGALLDRAGNDEYLADIFGQGAGNWFGVGVLADRAGNDRYQALEHCQGESVHLGAGFLGDWGGDDQYSCFEHCQGAGVDRAAGYLYDHSGDDNYVAVRDAQGVGLKTFGVGIFWDASGADRYTAAASAQGFAALVDPIPEDQLGVGILLDKGKGKDIFELPETDRPGRRPRIRNRQGIVVNR
jgi:hypothetical protein